MPSPPECDEARQSAYVRRGTWSLPPVRPEHGRWSTVAPDGPTANRVDRGWRTMATGMSQAHSGDGRQRTEVGIMFSTVFGPTDEATAIFYAIAVVLYVLAAFAAGTIGRRTGG